MLAVKSFWQYYVPSSDVLVLLETFRRMVNESLRVGLANNVASLVSCYGFRIKHAALDKSANKTGL